MKPSKKSAIDLVLQVGEEVVSLGDCAPMQISLKSIGLCEYCLNVDSKADCPENCQPVYADKRKVEPI